MTGAGYVTIISPFGIPALEKEFFNLRFFPTNKSFLTNLRLVYSEIRARGITATLVAGDLQFSLLFCYLASFLLKSRVKIQTQFHGDVYSRGVNHALRGNLRIIGSRVAVKVSDSIRIVSRFQELELKNRFHGIRAEFVVSPIPVDFSRIALPREFSQHYDLAFVGRLHKERGIVEAISILKNLITEMPDLKIVIVGQGPEESYMRKSLQDELANGAIEFFGTATPIELRRIYGGTRVLLSTASREGYGLTLREAVLSGMNVVARDNLGVREAAEDFPGAISFFNVTNEAIVAIRKALSQNNASINVSNFISEQRKRDQVSLETLVNVWLRD